MQQSVHLSHAEVRQHTLRLYRALGVDMPTDKLSEARWGVHPHRKRHFERTVLFAAAKRKREAPKGKSKTLPRQPPRQRARVEERQFRFFSRLPPELQQMVLVDALTPDFLGPKMYRWNVKQSIRRVTYMDGAVPYLVGVQRIYREYNRLFANLAVTTRELRSHVLDPSFRRLMYHLWYAEPMEGMDGEPDPTVSFSQDEALRMFVPEPYYGTDEETGLLEVEWYDVFLKSRIRHVLGRWKVLSSVRLWRFMFLTSRIARAELARNPGNWPAQGRNRNFGLTDTPEDPLEKWLPTSTQELATRFPDMEILTDMLSEAYDKKKRSTLAAIRPQILGVGAGLLTNKTLAGVHTFTPDDFAPGPGVMLRAPPGMTREKFLETKARQLNNAKFVLMRLGCVAPGSLGLVRSFVQTGNIGARDRATMDPIDLRDFPPIKSLASVLAAEDEFGADVFRMQVLSGVPHTEYLVGMATYHDGYYHPSLFDRPKVQTLHIDPPVDMGLLALFPEPDMAPSRTMICPGTLGRSFDILLEMLYLDDTSLSDLLKEYVKEHWGRAGRWHDVARAALALCSFAPRAAIPHPFHGATRAALVRNIAVKFREEWDTEGFELGDAEVFRERHHGTSSKEE